VFRALSPHPLDRSPPARRSLVTDDNLRVLGSGGSIWSIGDAATIALPRALDYADELFTKADVDNSDTLTLAELQARLAAALHSLAHC